MVLVHRKIIICSFVVPSIVLKSSESQQKRTVMYLVKKRSSVLHRCRKNIEIRKYNLKTFLVFYQRKEKKRKRIFKKRTDGADDESIQEGHEMSVLE